MGSSGVDPLFLLERLLENFFFFLISLGGRGEGTDLR